MIQMAKGTLKKIIKEQKGQVLPIVLVLLVIGGLLIAPTLDYASTSLKTQSQVYESKTLELYSADSGVEDALWHIQYNEDFELPAEAGDTTPVPFPETINDKTVGVAISNEGGGIYKISSTATSDDGDSTKIESYLNLEFADFSWLLDNAITSGGGVTLQPGSTVSGDISLPPDGVLDPPDYDPENGEVKREELVWPTAEELADIYWPEVEGLTPVPDGYIINIPSGTTADNPHVIGPLSAAGNLTIKGQGWIQFDGTIYIKGDLDFNATPTINMNLNQQTIFAEGNIYVPPGVTISGSGCIIAVKDVDFNPDISSAGEDFLLIMSVEGTVQLNPGSDFHGAVVGDVEVQLQPGITLSWLSPEGEGLNFPDGSGSAGDAGMSIRVASYVIS